MNSLEQKKMIFNKYLLGLEDTNKKQRKVALENLKKEILENSVEEEIVLVNYKEVQKYIIRAFHDDSEACRECAVLFVTQIIERVPKGDVSILSYIFPELIERFVDEVKEPSEEVRLLIVVLVHKIVLKYDSLVAPFFNDYIEILKKTIVDPYPKVKQRSCECAADLSKSLHTKFHMQSESLIKPMLQAINHQHYKVRIIVIRSIGDVICNGDNRSVSDVVTPFAERLFDQNAMVRKSVADVVGMWLLKLRDRYSYWHKLIPLMLTCLSDEIHLQAEESWLLWEEVGAQWVAENETDIKDKLDFLPEKLYWYPNGVRRPSIGCRELVQREMIKYLPGIVNELGDWKEDIRVKSAQLLCITLQHAEEKVIMHLSKILPAMYSAFCDSDQRVTVNIVRSAELIGYFVPPDVYCEQILSAIENGFNYGNLGVLASAINYSPVESISLGLVQSIMDCIYKDEQLCYSNKYEEQEQLVNLISVLLTKDDLDGLVKQRLYNILTCAQAVTMSGQIEKQARELSKKLCSSSENGVNVDEKLSMLYGKDLLLRLQPTIRQWTELSPQFLVFQYILKNYEYTILNETDLILAMLETCMEEDMDAEAVIKVMWVMFDVLQNEKLFNILLENGKWTFIEDILIKVLPKQLVWRPGRTQSALRIAASACLNQGFHNSVKHSSLKIDSNLLDLFLPILLSLIEDSEIKTRIFVLESLQTLIRASNMSDLLNVEKANSIVAVVVKRLDDVSDKVRMKSVNVIKEIYNRPAPLADGEICSAPVELALNKTLLEHLDDPSKDIQAAVLSALKGIGRWNPEPLLRETNLEICWNKDGCSDLIDYLKKQLSLRDIS